VAPADIGERILKYVGRLAMTQVWLQSQEEEKQEETKDRSGNLSKIHCQIEEQLTDSN
jgi:hypothetical protein